MTLIKRILRNNLFKDAGIYTGFAIFDRLLPFILLPIITRYLEPVEYGIYATFQALIAFFLPLISLNADSAILRNFFGMEESKFKIYFSNGIYIALITTLVFSIIFFFFGAEISSLVEFPIGWLFAIILTPALQFVTNITKNLWQVKREPIKYGLFSIFITMIRSITMLLLIIVVGMKWEGMVLSQLITYFLATLICSVILVKSNFIPQKFKKELIKDNLKFGLPLTVHSIGGWSSSLIGRVILTAMVGTAATGNYSIGATFGIVIALLQDSFNKAFVPYLFGILENINQKEKTKLVKITYAYHIVMLSVAILIGITGNYLIDFIFGVNYSEARVFVFWVALAYAFNGMYKMHVNYLFYIKKTTYIPIITISSGIINIGSTIVFINLFGSIGVAYGLLTGFLFSFLIAAYLSQYFYPLPYFGRN